MRRGRTGYCFANAQRRACPDGEQRYLYVEGFALGAAPTPIHHAWISDGAGAIEVTWPEPALAYMGIQFGCREWATLYLQFGQDRRHLGAPDPRREGWLRGRVPNRPQRPRRRGGQTGDESGRLTRLGWDAFLVHETPAGFQVAASWLRAGASAVASIKPGGYGRPGRLLTGVGTLPAHRGRLTCTVGRFHSVPGLR